MPRRGSRWDLIYEIPIPGDLLRRIDALWVLLLEFHPDPSTPVFRPRNMTTDQFMNRGSELAKQVANGDDDALFELIKHDSRYLASPYLLARVCEWKLTAAYASKRFDRPGAEERWTGCGSLPEQPGVV